MSLLGRGWVALGLWACLCGVGQSQERLVEKYLLEGRIAAGRTAVEAALREHPEQDELRFQLALTQCGGALSRGGEDHQARFLGTAQPSLPWQFLGLCRVV